MANATTGAPPQAGFANLVLNSQSTFRDALRAMSRPGLCVTLRTVSCAPQPLAPATAALCLTLLDANTPVWLDASANAPAVRDYLTFHCGCPIVGHTTQASFAVVTDCPQAPPLDAFDIGTDQYPDRSATIICQIAALEGGPPVTLSGPGIEHETVVALRGLAPDFAAQWSANRSVFPQGIDLFFTSGNQTIGLPRSIDWRV